MKRREFVTLLGGALAAWSPHPAWAQTAGKRPLVGYLDVGSAEAGLLSAFLAGMRELGHVEGQTFDIAPRFGEGNLAQLPALAEALAKLKPDVIVTQNTPAAIAAKNAAPALPIVSAVLAEPVRMGLVASYARPGGNLTGILSSVEGLNAKQLELAIEVVPGATRVGLLVNVENIGNQPQRQEIEAAAAARGVELVPAEVRARDDLAPAFKSLAGKRVQVLIVLRDTMVLMERRRVAELAGAVRLPTVYAWREGVDAGGLISYGIKLTDNYRRAAVFVDKILKGARAGDLPVEFPTKLELVINLKTAKALGLDVPPMLLARADEVIE
jgi:putative tryptophan/tyrosine transport system substrate-binding protein